jgi:chromosome partitioning protein
MHVISVVNLKGGVGKSTIAVNLACALSEKTSVTLIDVDPQGTATQYAERGLLPVRVAAAPLEHHKDADRWARGVLSTKADIVVLDAPPALGAATQAVIGVSDLVLIPCTASAADVHARSALLFHHVLMPEPASVARLGTH